MCPSRQCPKYHPISHCSQRHCLYPTPWCPLLPLCRRPSHILFRPLPNCPTHNHTICYFHYLFLGYHSRLPVLPNQIFFHHLHSFLDTTPTPTDSIWHSPSILFLREIPWPPFQFAPYLERAYPLSQKHCFPSTPPPPNAIPYFLES